MLQQYISVISILCCSKLFHVASRNLDVSYVSHTCCKCTFQMFQLFSDVCYIQMFFMLKCFTLFGRGRADWARDEAWGDGGAGGQQTVVLRSGRTGAVLVLSRLLSAARGEREGGQGRPAGTETGRSVRVSQSKGGCGQGEGGRGRATRTCGR